MLNTGEGAHLLAEEADVFFGALLGSDGGVLHRTRRVGP